MIQMKLASASPEKVTIFCSVISVINNQTSEEFYSYGHDTPSGILGYKFKLLLNEKN